MSSYCAVASSHPLHQAYHDTQYGFPLRDDDALFGRLVLPLMAPALFLLSFRDTALSFQGTFVPALIATETGPYYATFFLPHYIVDESFHMFRYGYGAAAAMILYFVTAFTIGMQFLLVEPE